VKDLKFIYFFLLILLQSVILEAQRWNEVDIEKTQKYVLVTFDKVGVKNNEIKIPIFNCVENCEETETWNFKLNSKELKDILLQNTPYLPEKGISSIVINNNGFRFFDFSETYFNPLLNFHDEVKNLKDFEKLVQNEINSMNFLNPFRKILKDTIESRLTIHPDFRISKNLENKIMNKSILIVFYIDKLKGEMRILKSRKDGGYNISTDLDLILKASIYQFNSKNNSFKLISTLEGKSENIEFMKNIKELYSINYFDSKFSEVPTFVDGEIEFKKSFEKSFKEAYTKIIDKLSKLSFFMPVSPITKYNKGIISFFVPENDLATLSNIRVDAPVYLQDVKKDGSLNKRAWGRVVVSSENNAEAKILKSDDLIPMPKYISVVSWDGTLWNSGIKYKTSTLKSSGVDLATSSEIILYFGSSMDVGYFFDDARFSNVWADLNIFLGTGSYSADGKTNISSISANYLFGVELGAEDRFYVNFRGSKKPFYFSAGGNLGFQIGNYDLDYHNNDEYFSQYDKTSGSGELNLFSSYLELKVGGGYTFRPDFEFYSFVGYNLNFFNYSYIVEDGKTLRKDAIDNINTKEIGYDSGMSLSIGTRFLY
jgi:hypothetical protein